MKSFHNIEKSSFRRGCYVGYCNGAWHIWHDVGDHRWFACKQISPGFTSAKTLTELSAYFEANNGQLVETND